MRVAIVCGLAGERRNLLRGWGRHYAAAPVVAVGMGPEAATRAARAVLDDGPDVILSFGLCGGLDPRLMPGIRVVPDAVADEDGEMALAGAALRHELTGEGGRLLSVAEPLADLDAKREAAARGFVAVDMESAAVARVAAEHGVRALVVRAVADPATRPLPHVARVAMGDDGRLRPLAAAAALTGWPREWRLVWRAARDARAADASLRDAAATLARLAGQGLL